MMDIAKDVVIIPKCHTYRQTVSVIAMKKGNVELRYDRLVLALEELERKRARKVKQILKIRKRLIL